MAASFTAMQDCVPWRMLFRFLNDTIPSGCHQPPCMVVLVFSGTCLWQLHFCGNGVHFYCVGPRSWPFDRYEQCTAIVASIPDLTELVDCPSRMGVCIVALCGHCRVNDAAILLFTLEKVYFTGFLKRRKSPDQAVSVRL